MTLVLAQAHTPGRVTARAGGVLRVVVGHPPTPWAGIDWAHCAAGLLTSYRPQTGSGARWRPTTHTDPSSRRRTRTPWWS